MQATVEQTEQIVDEQRLETILAEMHAPEYAGVYWSEGRDGQLRLKKAERLYRQGMVSRDTAGFYHVAGEDTGELYTVDRACDCKYGKSSPERWCSHRIATVIHRKMQALFTNEARQDVQEGSAPTTAENVMAEVGWQEPAPTPFASTTVTELEQPLVLDHPRPSEPVIEIRLGLRPISAIIADLSRPLPPECFDTLRKGGAEISFLHWHTVAAVLDAYAPGWEGEVVRVDKIGERVSVIYRIRIPCAEGWATRDNSGMEDEDKDDYGDVMTNSIATAFKRAAAQFGVGREKYDSKGHTEKFLARLRGDREKLLHAVQEKVAEVGLDWTTVFGSVRQQIGAYHESLVPVWALRSTLSQLQTMTVRPKQDAGSN